MQSPSFRNMGKMPAEFQKVYRRARNREMTDIERKAILECKIDLGLHQICKLTLGLQVIQSLTYKNGIILFSDMFISEFILHCFL